MKLVYRNAEIGDIEDIQSLQEKYHTDTISEEDRKDGFVTTLFTYDQFKSLIEKENGIAICCDDKKVVAYAMAASWNFWKEWPLFEKMINDLPNNKYLGVKLNEKNSYQYGPICIDKKYRGTEVLPKLFDKSRETMKKRFPILITFINKTNPRSKTAHINKLGLDIIKEFKFNDNNYIELGYDTSKKVEI